MVLLSLFRLIHHHPHRLQSVSRRGIKGPANYSKPSVNFTTSSRYHQKQSTTQLKMFKTVSGERSMTGNRSAKNRILLDHRCLRRYRRCLGRTRSRRSQARWTTGGLQQHRWKPIPHRLQRTSSHRLLVWSLFWCLALLERLLRSSIDLLGLQWCLQRPSSCPLLLKLLPNQADPSLFHARLKINVKIKSIRQWIEIFFMGIGRTFRTNNRSDRNHQLVYQTVACFFYLF